EARPPSTRSFINEPLGGLASFVFLAICNCAGGLYNVKGAKKHQGTDVYIAPEAQTAPTGPAADSLRAPRIDDRNQGHINPYPKMDTNGRARLRRTWFF
ncbi:MAG: hypothetical protein AAB538_00760, partial [Patescibacteria group bacterium]